MAFSRPLIADEVDNLYPQLMEIHAIGTAQLAECTCWRRSDSTPSLARAKIGWQGPNGTPSVTKMALPPSIDFSPQVSLRQQGPHGEPVARCQDCHVSVWPKQHVRNPRHNEPSGRRR
jgi:hypothetical protein